MEGLLDNLLGFHLRHANHVGEYANYLLLGHNSILLVRKRFRGVFWRSLSPFRCAASHAPSVSPVKTRVKISRPPQPCDGEQAESPADGLFRVTHDLNQFVVSTCCQRT